MARARPVNLLSRLRGTVQISAHGLSWDIEGVAADDMARVSEAALDAMRAIRQRYPELVPELQPIHGGTIEGPDEDGQEEYRELSTLAPSTPRRVGFGV